MLISKSDKRQFYFLPLHHLLLFQLRPLQFALCGLGAGFHVPWVQTLYQILDDKSVRLHFVLIF